MSKIGKIGNVFEEYIKISQCQKLKSGPFGLEKFFFLLLKGKIPLWTENSAECFAVGTNMLKIARAARYFPPQPDLQLYKFEAQE